MEHNFKVINGDTDSIMFCKDNMSEFSEQEQVELIQEINSLLPEKIKMAHDGYFKNVLIVKAKNYLLDDGKKVKTKGSALKATTKEVALKEFINKIIYMLMHDQKDQVVELYHNYVKEILNLQDINRWASKKSITSKVLAAARTTERKVLTAIEDEEYQEGDKMYFYFDKDEQLKLASNWCGDHHVDKLLEKLYKTTATFYNIIDKELFLNYKLKRNKEKLQELINGT